MCAPFLSIYLSSFWSWTGITIGAWIVLVGTLVLTVSILKIIFDR